MKMQDLVDKYLRVRRDEMGQRTFDALESLLTRFATSWDKTRRTPRSLDQDWVREWLYEVRQGGAGGNGKAVSPAYYNKTVQRLGMFLKYLLQRNAVGDSFVLDACKPIPVGEPKEYLRLSAGQVVQMIQTCEDPWERWALAFASQTLGRVSELVNARIAHLHLDKGELYWYRRKTFDQDMMPITRQLADEWRRWALVYQDYCGPLDRNKGWFLIPRRYSTPLGRKRWAYVPDKQPTSLSQLMQRHAARITGDDAFNLKGQGVHIMRRSMARALYDRLVADGVPEPTALNRVQVMLGHSDPRTTMIYIGVQPDRQKRNELLMGSSLLWVEDDNVVQLRSVDNG